jgi:phosphoglycolate phosphatase-like HAD superfamily hydrolase
VTGLLRPVLPAAVLFDCDGVLADTEALHDRIISDEITVLGWEISPEESARRFRGLRVRGLADPSAAHGADRQAGESSWIEIVGRVAGIPIVPAPGNNDPTIRQEALRLPMLRLIDGRLPGLVVCPVHARPLIKALTSDYKFAVAGGKRTTTIVKNWASHLVEAAQYGALDGGAYHEVMARTATRRSQHRSMLAQINFNPLR